MAFSRKGKSKEQKKKEKYSTVGGEFAWFSSFGNDDGDDDNDDVTMRWVIYLGWFGSRRHACICQEIRDN